MQAIIKIEDVYYICLACFLRQISVASNAIQTIDNEAVNEVYHLIIYCLNCIRRDEKGPKIM
jgi:hypothetical protein